MTEQHHATQRQSHHGHLLIMVAISFVAMYALMYAMVDRFRNVHHNLNQVYMAGLMSAVMVPIELAVMRFMYHDRRKNLLLLAGAAMVLVGCWFGIRRQAAIGDEEFLRSMNCLL